MFEGIMKRIGYYKVEKNELFTDDILDKVLSMGFYLCDSADFDKLIVLNDAEDNKTDVFIDYVKKTDTQKFYVRKGKKNVMVLEI